MSQHLLQHQFNELIESQTDISEIAHLLNTLSTPQLFHKKSLKRSLLSHRLKTAYEETMNSLFLTGQTHGTFLCKKFGQYSQNSLSEHDFIFPCFITNYQDYLNSFLKDIDKILLSEKQKNSINNLGKTIPSAFIYERVLCEFRLQDNSEVDLLVGIPKTEFFYNELNKNSHFKNIFYLLNECKKLNYSKNKIFLEGIEYDVNNLKDEHNIWFIVDGNWVQKWTKISFINLFNKLEIGLPTTCFDKMKSVVNYKPDKIKIAGFGCMQSRHKDHYKIYIDNFPLSYLQDFLSYINWQGDNKLIQKFLTESASLNDNQELSIDIQGDKVKRIDITLSRNRNKNILFDKIFDILVSLNICLPEKKQALLNSEFIYWGPYFNFMMSHLRSVKVLIGENSMSAKAYLRYSTSTLFDSLQLPKQKIKKINHLYNMET